MLASDKTPANLADWVASEEAKAARQEAATAAVSTEASDLATEQAKATIWKQITRLDGVIGTRSIVAAHDAVIQSLLASREAQRASLKERLRAMKPFSVQMQIAVSERDKAYELLSVLEADLFTLSV